MTKGITKSSYNARYDNYVAFEGLPDDLMPCIKAQPQEIVRTKTLYLITGLPGAGKTTMADVLLRWLHRQDLNAVHLGSDMYEAYWTKEYEKACPGQFLRYSHQWVQDRCRSSMRMGDVGVIIDDVCSDYTTRIPYLMLAATYGYRICYIHLTSMYGSVHNVYRYTVLNGGLIIHRVTQEELDAKTSFHLGYSDIEFLLLPDGTLVGCPYAGNMTNTHVIEVHESPETIHPDLRITTGGIRSYCVCIRP